MFKKIALAAALAGLTSQAMGLTLSLNPDESALDSTTADAAAGVAPIHSIEGLTSATSMTAANAGILLGGSYSVGDKITVTYSTTFAAGATAANSLEVIMPGEGTGNVNDTMTLSRDGIAAVAGLSSITYTVADIEYIAGLTSANSTNITATNSAIVYTDVGLTFTPCTAACTVTVNASGTRAGAVIDAGPATGLTIASAVAEYSVSATVAYNGIIDVGADRKKFTGAAVSDAGELTRAAATTTNGKEMTVASTVNNNDGTAITAAAATASKSIITVTGDWGFLDCDTATAGTQLTDATNCALGANVLGGDADYTSPAASNTDTVQTYTDADGTETVFSMTITSTNKAVIPVQTISSVWTVSGTTAVGSNPWSKAITTAMGGFTMNGAQTNVYAVPYGPGVQQYIWLTNEGASDGTITATAFDTAGTAYPTTGEYDLGALGKKSHKSIAADLLAKLKADGMDDTVSQRLQLAITVTLPVANVNTYAAYRVGDARLALETSASKDRATTAASSMTTLTANVATVDGVVDAVLVDSAAIDTATAATLVDTAAIDTATAAILVDTDYGGTSQLSVAVAAIKSETAALVTETDLLCDNLASVDAELAVVEFGGTDANTANVNYRTTANKAGAALAACTN